MKRMISQSQPSSRRKEPKPSYAPWPIKPVKKAILNDGEGGVMALGQRTVAFCDTCAKHQDEVLVMIALPKSLHICSECVELMSEIVASKKELTAPKPVDEAK